VRFIRHVFFGVDRLCGLVVRVPGYRSRDPGFDYWGYQIFWEVVGLERGPLSLVSIIEELLGRNSSGSGLENREYGRGDPLRWPRDTLYPQKLVLTSPTCGDRSVGIVTSYRLDDRGVGVGVLVGWRIFSSPRRPDRLWGPPNLLSKGTGSYAPGVKRPKRESDHSPPASAEVQKMWIYTSTPQYAFMA
jgi:hypothetical protein